MRYPRTITAAGVALALASGALLAQASQPDDPAEIETTESADPAVSATVPDDDRHRSSRATDGERGVTSADGGEADGDRHRETSSTPTADGGEPVAFGPVHEVVPGPGGDGPAGADPSTPIGGVSTNGGVPEGIGLTSFPGNAPAPTPHDGPSGYTTGPGCHASCIESGVAYPRGFGAELVVKTTVDADIFISVIADTDADGDWEFSEFAWSDGKVDDFRWALDHLDPDQTYYAMVAATDDNDKTDHAFGEFTTLSQRDIYITLGDVTVHGGPDNVSKTSLWMRVNGSSHNYTPGEAGIPMYDDVPRHLDLRLLVLRRWSADICEAWVLNEDGPSHGHWSDACLAWHHASVDDIDLDAKPAGKTRWTQTSVSTTIATPDGAGGALPPGYGDPYYFSFSAPVTVSVTYR